MNLNTLLSLLDFGLDDEPILSPRPRCAYRGEPVAAVIAETEAEARAAAAAVRVEWEVLPHVLDVEEAIKPGAPAVLEIYPNNKFVYHGKYDHQKLRYGDVDAALARGRSRRRGPLPDVAHRAGPDRDLRRHRRARTERPLRLLHLDPGAVLFARARRPRC